MVKSKQKHYDFRIKTIGLPRCLIVEFHALKLLGSNIAPITWGGSTLHLVWWTCESCMWLQLLIPWLSKSEINEINSPRPSSSSLQRTHCIPQAYNLAFFSLWSLTSFTHWVPMFVRPFLSFMGSLFGFTPTSVIWSCCILRNNDPFIAINPYISRGFNYFQPYLVKRAWASGLFFFCQCQFPYFLTGKMIILTLCVIQ